MKKSVYKNIAFYLAVANAMLFIVVGLMATEILKYSFGMGLIIVSGIVLLILNIWVLRYLNYNFINTRLNSIYKIINSKESTTTVSQVKHGGMSEDLLDKTEKEVIHWANLKEFENREQKKMEIYRKEFLGNVSHELKTPIFSVLGFVETLLDGGMYDKNINRKYLKKAEKNIQRLIAIIEDLDKISRFESDQIQLVKQEFDLHELIVEVIEGLEDAAQKHNIKVQIASDLDVPFLVFADRDKIYQVLTNLIFNSIKYGNSGGWSILNYRIKKSRAEISISDSGIGIEPHHMPRLFERFYRVDSNRSRKLGGTGLGLAIVKHILEAHDQTIFVNSKPGEGTTFTFTLELSNSL